MFKYVLKYMLFGAQHQPQVPLTYECGCFGSEAYVVLNHCASSSLISAEFMLLYRERLKLVDARFFSLFCLLKVTAAGKNCGRDFSGFSLTASQGSISASLRRLE